MGNTQEYSKIIEWYDVDTYKRNWMNCLPGNISNLFYRQSQAEGIQRVSYYTLDLDPNGRNDIREYTLDSYLQCVIRITMGCTNENGFEQLYPIFRLVYLNNTIPGSSGEPPIVLNSLSFSLNPQYGSVAPLPSLNPILENAKKSNGEAILLPEDLTEITPGVADLFHKKWLELSDAELAVAFSGITQRIDKVDPAPTSPAAESQQLLTSKRVRSYVFSPADTQIIINYILNPAYEQYSVRMYMGAGLTVRITHPFSFRPMLFLPDLPSSVPGTELQDEQDDPDSGTYFERSHPCPPYCEPPED